MVDQQQPHDSIPRKAGAQPTWFGLAVGLPGGIVIGLLWAWLAEVAQGFMAPVLLFPLLIGAGTGFTAVGWIRITQIGHRRTILLSVVLAAAIAALFQHYFTYLDVYYWHRPMVVGQATGQDLATVIDRCVPSFGHYIQAQLQLGRPLFFGYHAQGWVVWLTWAIDGLLTVASAVAVALPAIHIPYCDHCQSWYRVTRNGKIDIPTAKRLAELAHVVLPEHTLSRRYRLSNCHGGCSPTCCELSWEDDGGRLSLVQFWLSAVERNQLAFALDQVASETDDDDSLDEI
jgi:hypothetical protein